MLLCHWSLQHYYKDESPGKLVLTNSTGLRRIHQLVFAPLFFNIYCFVCNIQELQSINMAWLSGYLGYGNKSAAGDSELKLLREDRALRSKVQGEELLFLHKLHTY